MKKIEIKGPIVSNDVGWLYNYFGMDAAYPNLLKEGLADAAGDDVIIEINSPGGVCVYGYEMYTAIKEYEGKVTVHVISAMSAATLIVCAADEALISDTGIFMIHNAQSQVSGDYRDMEMEADALKEFNAGIINAYVRKTGKSREEIQALMDKDSYMSPQTAIENGFVDGYIFGDPNQKVEPEALATKIVAADVQIIPEDKAIALRQMLSQLDKPVENMEIAPVQNEEQKIGVVAVSDKSNEGGKNHMTLQEFLQENPEAQAEIDAMRAEARTEGVNAERNRIQSLDNIANAVTADALTEAKYGENPVDGPTLAYQAMANGDKLAKAYLDAAKEDSEESGGNEVGVGEPGVGEEQTDDADADALANHVNSVKGGK